MLIRGLYVITDARLTGRTLLEKTRQAIEGGAALIQYRAKNTDTQQRTEDACALQALCERYDMPFIINDDVTLAQECCAHGVHLGKDDETIQQARAVLGSRAIIGASCYNNLKRAITAQESGADYVALGSFFPSLTKPDAVSASITLIGQAKSLLKVPVVAIGGITPDNAVPLVAAGVDAVAVIDGVFGQTDAHHAARCYARLFDQVERSRSFA